MISVEMKDGSIRTFPNPDLRMSFDRECIWIYKLQESAIEKGKSERLVFKVIRDGWKEVTYHKDTSIDGVKDSNIG